MKLKFDNGLHEISNQEYHNSEGISRSMLIDMEKSPYLYWYNHLSGKASREEPTNAMNIGSALHNLTLEPQKFEDEFFIISQQTKPRKDTAPYHKMLEEAHDRIILTPDDYLLAESMKDALINDHAVKALLENCKIEQSIYFEHVKTGIQCKFRPDAMSGSIVIDLKTTTDASMKAMQYSCLNYGYYLSAGIACRALESIGIDMNEYVFICVEKKEPYQRAIYRLEDDALDFGLQQFDDLMFRLEHCLEKNKWPSYGIKDLSIPAWALKNNEFEEIE